MHKWLWVKFKINLLPRNHIIDRYFNAVQAWGIQNDGKGPDIYIPDHDHFQLPVELQNGYVSAVIGGTHFTKRMPANKWIEMLKDIQMPVVLLGGKEEEKAGNYIQSKLNHIYNYCGKLRLYQSVSLIQQSQYVITHDTGLMHMAAAMQKPMTVLWGNTDPLMGLGPYSQQGNYHADASFVKNLKCRPCSKIGYSACPKKHFKCMMQQPTHELGKRIQGLLQ